jgi:hypothetical protein
LNAEEATGDAFLMLSRARRRLSQLKFGRVVWNCLLATLENKELIFRYEKLKAEATEIQIVLSFNMSIEKRRRNMLQRVQKKRTFKLFLVVWC